MATLAVTERADLTTRSGRRWSRCCPRARDWGARRRGRSGSSSTGSGGGPGRIAVAGRAAAIRGVADRVRAVPAVAARRDPAADPVRAAGPRGRGRADHLGRQRGLRSPPSSRPSGYPGPARAGPAPAPTGFWLTRPTARRGTGLTCAAAGSQPPSRSRRIRQPTGAGWAARAAGPGLRPRALQAAPRRGMRHQPPQAQPRRSHPLGQARRPLPGDRHDRSGSCPTYETRP